MEWETTSTLLGRLRTFSSETAWEGLDHHFRAPLVRLARRAGVPPGEAEDVAQDTLAAFAESYRKGTYEPSRGRLRSWLFGIAHKKVLTRLGQRGAGAERAAGSLHDHAEPDRLESLWLEEWRRLVLDRALARVREEVEAVTFLGFRLAVLERVPTDEVCARTGLNRTRLYNAKHRVTKRLRELTLEYDDA